MEKQPLIDRSTILPLGIGMLSLFGICIVLLLGRALTSSHQQASVIETATPYKYLLLGTEPGISTPEFTPESGAPGSDPFEGDGSGDSSSPSEETTPTPRGLGLVVTSQAGGQQAAATNSSIAVQTISNAPSDVPIFVFGSGSKTPTLDLPILPSRTPTLTRTPYDTATITPSRTKAPTQPGVATSTSTSVIVTSTPTRTATSASTAPLNPGTYDDTDSHLVYGGSWIAQNNVSGAFQNTLHVSNTSGNSITFRFIGTEVRLFYQSGSGLGVLNVNIDNQNFDIDQADSDATEWVSTPFVNGTHTITITHESGGSVNLDAVVVPDLILTPTTIP